MPLPRKCRWRACSRRPGFTMLVAMILLTIITGLSVAWARRVILQQRQVSQRLQATQSEWLASSAIQRALSQLAADSSFNQEIWALSPADMQSKYGANVEIRVSPSESGDARQIEVVVDYPNDPLLRQRVRRVQQVTGPFTEKSS
jgi:type II secretory pathway pseudopilin PulG